MIASEYPIRIELDHGPEVERWRPFANWFLAIPHLIVLYVLNVVTAFVAVAAFLVVLFTGRIPSGLFDFIVMYQRYQWRVTSFVAGLRGGYPPFDFQTKEAEPDVAVYQADRPERLSRLLLLVKWLALFPHYVVLMLLGIAAMFAWFIGAIAVLVTGRWPDAIHHLLVGLARWSFRVNGYLYFLTDRYPPFSLD